jgi:hypothetical protein
MVVYFFFLEKVYIPLLNYHSILNVPPKLPIVSMSSSKLQKKMSYYMFTYQKNYQKNVNVSLKPTKRQK